MLNYCLYWLRYANKLYESANSSHHTTATQTFGRYDTVKAAALSQFIALSLTMERCYVGGGGGAQYRQGMAAAAVTPVTFV